LKIEKGKMQNCNSKLKIDKIFVSLQGVLTFGFNFEFLILNF